MYGYQCDHCEYVTHSEDDHAVTEDGDYLCLKCFEKYNNECPNCGNNEETSRNSCGMLRCDNCGWDEQDEEDE